MNILCTIGDCNGIGLEVLIKALQLISEDSRHNLTISLCCNSRTITEYLEQADLPAYVENSILYFSGFNLYFCTPHKEELVCLLYPADKLADWILTSP